MKDRPPIQRGSPSMRRAREPESRRAAIDGNVAIVGYFRGTVDFDPTSGTANLTSAGSHDIFVSRLTSSGAYVSAQRFGGSNSDMGRGITRDSSNNLFFTGFYSGSATFDTNSGVYTLTSSGGQDMFVAKLFAPAAPPVPQQEGDHGGQAAGRPDQRNRGERPLLRQVSRGEEGERQSGGVGRVRMISLREARSVRPPAARMPSRTVSRPLSAKAPGAFTSPST